ncbi:hypothetical protein E2C01_029308 [Portunus trituberculatus]|uniref:Uncharacterized protein n=1 Tax=Portunus trituberculatus TaxID=210409 RepID=A0A5B7EMN7_PORTR|nr:hypothetical protein [Portunus trituberculatus]
MESHLSYRHYQQCNAPAMEALICPTAINNNVMLPRVSLRPHHGNRLLCHPLTSLASDGAPRWNIVLLLPFDRPSPAPQGNTPLLHSIVFCCILLLSSSKRAEEKS